MVRIDGKEAFVYFVSPKSADAGGRGGGELSGGLAVSTDDRGAPATVEFFGVVQGSIGLYQITPWFRRWGRGIIPSN